MDVMLGSDNVGDAFYPYGNYDPLAILRLAAPVCHVEPQEWLDSITTLPSRLIGSERIQPLQVDGSQLHMARCRRPYRSHQPSAGPPRCLARRYKNLIGEPHEFCRTTAHL